LQLVPHAIQAALDPLHATFPPSAARNHVTRARSQSTRAIKRGQRPRFPRGAVALSRAFAAATAAVTQGMASAVLVALHAASRERTAVRGVGEAALLEAACAVLGDDQAPAAWKARELLVHATVRLGFEAGTPGRSVACHIVGACGAALDASSRDAFATAAEGGRRRRAKRTRKDSPSGTEAKELVARGVVALARLAEAAAGSPGVEAAAVVGAAAAGLAELARAIPQAVARDCAPAVLSMLDVAAAREAASGSSQQQQACLVCRLWWRLASSKPSSWSVSELTGTACESLKALTSADGSPEGVAVAAGAADRAVGAACTAMRASVTADATGVRFSEGRADLASVAAAHLATDPAGPSAGLGHVVFTVLGALAASPRRPDAPHFVESVRSSALVSSACQLLSSAIWDGGRQALAVPWLLKLARQLAMTHEHAMHDEALLTALSRRHLAEAAMAVSRAAGAGEPSVRAMLAAAEVSGPRIRAQTSEQVMREAHQMADHAPESLGVAGNLAADAPEASASDSEEDSEAGDDAGSEAMEASSSRVPGTAPDAAVRSEDADDDADFPDIV